MGPSAGTGIESSSGSTGPATSVLAGIFSSGAVGLISLASGVVLLPFVISAFGAGLYGVWLVCVAGATYLYYADLGIGVSIIHFSSRIRGGDDRTTHGRLLSSGIAWTGPIAAVIAAASAVFSLWYLDRHSATQAISSAESTTMVACAVTLAACLVLRPFTGTLIGLGHLTVERKYQLSAAVFRLVGTLIACVGTGIFAHLVIVETAALIIPSGLAMLDVVIRRGIRPTPRQARRRELRMMFGYGIKSFGVNAVGAVILQAGTVICGLVASPTDVTFYSAALRLYQGVRQVLTWVTEPFRPALSRIFVEQSRAAQGARIAQASMFTTFVFTGCVLVVFLVLGDLFVEEWLGSRVPTHRVALATTVLLAGLALNSLHIPLVSTLDAAGHPGRFFPYQATWALCFIGAAIPLGTHFGFVGVAAALSAPLVVLEPLYILTACRALPQLRSGLLTRVLAPACLLLGIPCVILAVYAAVLDPTGQWWAALTALTIFGAALALTGYTARGHLPIGEITSAIRTST